MDQVRQSNEQVKLKEIEMHGNTVLEVEFSEVGNEKYTELFKEALRDRSR